MYEVTFDDEVIGFLEKLPKDIRKRIFEKILSTKENPFHFFDRLSGRKDYKLRVGDYRVIAGIEENSKKIHVTLIRNRKHVYKQL